MVNAKESFRYSDKFNAFLGQNWPKMSREKVTPDIFHHSQSSIRTIPVDVQRVFLYSFSSGGLAQSIMSQAPHSSMDYPEEYTIRLKKASDLEEGGETVYPAGCARTHSCAAARMVIEQEGHAGSVTVAGRIRQIRKHGGSTFVRLEDESGDIQLYFKKDTLGDERYTRFSDTIDLGDILEGSGELFITKTGETTVMVSLYTLLAKALLPLPDQWHGLADVEQRYRHRELDLIVNDDARRRFVLRSKLVSSLRRFLDELYFLEV